ncbi:hypothetical protein B0H13DRAFT_1895713 [Mycena leptocephala]|nr:hypothetical protein B0H13DRAFT_1895713 [Mycena leptocephala]
MPLFDSASGFQITGGTFIDNAGDININSTQIQWPGKNSDLLQALEFVAAQGPSRQLSGVERNGRQAGAVRRLPYGVLPALCNYSVPDEVEDISDRPPIPSSSRNLPHQVPDDGSCSAASISSLLNPPSFPFSQPEHDFNFLSFFESPSTTGLAINRNFSSVQDSTAAYPELFHDLMNSTTFEYPSTNPAPVSGTREYYGQILSSDNQPTFDVMSTTLVLNSVPSMEIFSEQTQPPFTPLFHPSNTTADVFFYPSPNSEFLAGSFGEPASPAANIGTNIFSAATINHFPWADPPLQPRTSINGGTFIGGNVNHVQQHGEPAAGDATHDAEDRFPQPRCHPETRKKMLDVLWNWTCGIEPPTNLIFEDYENVHANN